MPMIRNFMSHQYNNLLQCYDMFNIVINNLFSFFSLYEENFLVTQRPILICAHQLLFCPLYTVQSPIQRYYYYIEKAERHYVFLCTTDLFLTFLSLSMVYQQNILYNFQMTIVLECFADKTGLFFFYSAGIQVVLTKFPSKGQGLFYKC